MVYITQQQILTRLRRYKALNETRLQRALDLMHHEARFCLSMVPVLLHYNHINLPGYRTGYIPHGIDLFTPDAAQQNYLKSILLPDSPPLEEPQEHAILGLYAMGSTSSLGQSDSSDVDIWVCVKANISPEGMTALQNKCRFITTYVKARGVELNLFVTPEDRFTNFSPDCMDEENCGSAQNLFLLDEFYRSSIRLCGRYIIWYLISTKEEQSGYSDYVNFLLHGVSGLGTLSATRGRSLEDELMAAQFQLDPQIADMTAYEAAALLAPPLPQAPADIPTLSEMQAYKDALALHKAQIMAMQQAAERLSFPVGTAATVSVAAHNEVAAHEAVSGENVAAANATSSGASMGDGATMGVGSAYGVMGESASLSCSHRTDFSPAYLAAAAAAACDDADTQTASYAVRTVASTAIPLDEVQSAAGPYSMALLGHVTFSGTGSFSATLTAISPEQALQAAATGATAAQGMAAADSAVYSSGTTASDQLTDYTVSSVPLFTDDFAADIDNDSDLLAATVTASGQDVDLTRGEQAIPLSLLAHICPLTSQQFYSIACIESVYQPLPEEFASEKTSWVEGKIILTPPAADGSTANTAVGTGAGTDAGSGSGESSPLHKFMETRARLMQVARSLLKNRAFNLSLPHFLGSLSPATHRDSTTKTKDEAHTADFSPAALSTITTTTQALESQGGIATDVSTQRREHLEQLMSSMGIKSMPFAVTDFMVLQPAQQVGMHAGFLDENTATSTAVTGSAASAAGTGAAGSTTAFPENTTSVEHHAKEPLQATTFVVTATGQARINTPASPRARTFSALTPTATLEEQERLQEAYSGSASKDAAAAYHASFAHDTTLSTFAQAYQRTRYEQGGVQYELTLDQRHYPDTDEGYFARHFAEPITTNTTVSAALAGSNTAKAVRADESFTAPAATAASSSSSSSAAAATDTALNGYATAPQSTTFVNRVPTAAAMHLFSSVEKITLPRHSSSHKRAAASVSASTVAAFRSNAGSYGADELFADAAYDFDAAKNDVVPPAIAATSVRTAHSTHGAATSLAAAQLAQAQSQPQSQVQALSQVQAFSGSAQSTGYTSEAPLNPATAPWSPDSAAVTALAAEALAADSAASGTSVIGDAAQAGNNAGTTIVNHSRKEWQVTKQSGIVGLSGGWRREAVTAAAAAIPRLDKAEEIYPEWAYGNILTDDECMQAALHDGWQEHEAPLKAEEWFDFGSVLTSSPTEYFGSGLWLLYKAIDSPFKVVLKILLMEAYSNDYPNSKLLSSELKEYMHSHDGYSLDLDSYYLMYLKVSNYLQSLQQRQKHSHQGKLRGRGHDAFVALESTPASSDSDFMAPVPRRHAGTSVAATAAMSSVESDILLRDGDDRPRYDRLNLMRKCFYLKIFKGLTHKSVHHHDDYQLKRELLNKFSKRWGWSDAFVQELESINSWKVEAVRAFNLEVYNTIMESYMALLRFSVRHGIEYAITSDDAGVLSRKLYAAFDLYPGKIPLLHCSMPHDLEERNLTFIRPSEYSLCRKGWHLYPAAPDDIALLNTKVSYIGSRLSEVVTWACFNGLLSSRSRTFVVGAHSPVSPLKIKILSSDIRRVLEPQLGHVSESELQSAPKLRAALIMLNLEQDDTELLQNNLANIGDGSTLCYGRQRVCLIGSLDLVMVNSWGEIRSVTLPHGEEGVVELLATLLRIFANSSDEQTQSSASTSFLSQVEVCSYAASYQDLIKYDLEATIRQVFNCLNAGGSSEYVFEVGRNTYTARAQGERGVMIQRNGVFGSSDFDISVLSRYGMRPEFALQVPPIVDRYATSGIMQYFFAPRLAGHWDIYIINERNEVKIYHDYYGSRAALVNAINRFYTSQSQNRLQYTNRFNLPQYFVLSADQKALHPFTIRGLATEPAAEAGVSSVGAGAVESSISAGAADAVTVAELGASSAAEATA